MPMLHIVICREIAFSVIICQYIYIGMGGRVDGERAPNKDHANIYAIDNTIYAVPKL